MELFVGKNFRKIVFYLARIPLRQVLDKTLNVAAGLVIYLHLPCLITFLHWQEINSCQADISPQKPILIYRPPGYLSYLSRLKHKDSSVVGSLTIKVVDICFRWQLLYLKPENNSRLRLGAP